jgi:hypothetical protein
MPENEEVAPAAEAQQEAAQSTEAKAEATATTSDELSEGDLEAAAGGKAKPGPPSYGLPIIG